MLEGYSKKKEKKGKNRDRLMYGAPFHYQVYILLGRTWRTIWREKVLICLSVFSANQYNWNFVLFLTNSSDPYNNAFHSPRLYFLLDGHVVLADRGRRRRYIQQRWHGFL